MVNKVMEKFYAKPIFDVAGNCWWHRVTQDTADAWTRERLSGMTHEDISLFGLPTLDRWQYQGEAHVVRTSGEAYGYTQ